MRPKRILVCGAGIAGLTLAIELQRRGFQPLVIEREPALRSEGYMMDFFGTGWAVAERMDLVDRLRAVRYPIDAVDFVDGAGRSYLHVPIERVRRALADRYVYLRRQDLERILAERARETGVEIRYGSTLDALDDRGDCVAPRFAGGGEESFALAIGADGVHSRVRELAFGPEAQFARFLGLHVAAYHVARRDVPVVRAAQIYEEPDRLAMTYPLDTDRIDVTFVLREPSPHIPHAERRALLQDRLRNAGWIVPQMLQAIPQNFYFDSAMQIAMPHWHRGRIALIGDACGCLTLLAGQGSHMAMAGGYLLAEALEEQDDHRAAFENVQRRLKPHVDRKQASAARFAGLFVPTTRSRPWLRRLALRAFFSRPLLGIGLRAFGAGSVLPAQA
jgi:2-polyprenyl-6-methoxyphenol hydroxylase-like FAD-dependent oxidoreductase